MKILSLFFAVLIFISIECPAQTPVSINVTSLTINKPYILMPQMAMAVEGLPAPLQSPITGYGGGLIFSLEGCRPCFLGATFSTSFNSESSFYGFNISGYGDNKRVKFTLTSNSPAVTLPPSLRLKNRFVSRTVPAVIKGKIEIYEGNTLLAIDDEVDLSGTVTAEFVQYRLISSGIERRGFDFRSVVLSYSE